MGLLAFYVKEDDSQQGLTWLRSYTILDETKMKIQLKNNDGVVGWFPKTHFIKQLNSQKELIVQTNPKTLEGELLTGAYVENTKDATAKGKRYSLESKEDLEHFEALLRGYNAMGYQIVGGN